METGTFQFSLISSLMWNRTHMLIENEIQIMEPGLKKTFKTFFTNVVVSIDYNLWHFDGKLIWDYLLHKDNILGKERKSNRLKWLWGFSRNSLLTYLLRLGLWKLAQLFHCVKSVRIMRLFGPYFRAFGLNMERKLDCMHWWWIYSICS